MTTNKRISVIGAGKLGICFALNAEKSGWEIVCVDNNENYINKVNSGSFKTAETGVTDLLKRSRLALTSDIQKAINHTDLHFLFVQTPSLPDGSYDHSRILEVCEHISKGKSKEPAYVVICSTTMPGFCKELQAKVSKHGIVVLYNPEFIAQGSILYDQRNPGLILVGCDTYCEAADTVVAVHKSFNDNNSRVWKTSLTTSELTKMGINCFLTVKTSYANTLGDLAFSMGEDPAKLLEVVGSDHRVGPKRFGYGYGYGGPCLPRDNKALGVTAANNGMSNSFFRYADAANMEHLFKYAEYLASTQSSINKHITISGVAYKSGTTILEESQQLLTCKLLKEQGYVVTIMDSREVLDQVEKLYPGMFILKDYSSALY